MVQLLVKDLRIQRTTLIVGFLCVGLLFFALGAFEGVPLAFPAAVFSHFLIVVASKMDGKNNNGRMLASLPLRRKDIVSAKYTGVIMFIVIAYLLSYVWRVFAVLVLPAAEMPWINVRTMLVILTIQLIFNSVYFPLFFAFGSRLVQVLDMIVIFSLAGIAIAVAQVAEWMHADIGSKLGKWFADGDPSVYGYAAGAGILLFVASWCLSMFVYERRNV